MKDINLDFKFSADYSLSTEERFAIRRWLESFLKVINFGTKDELLSYLDIGFGAIGFLETARMGKQDFVDFVVTNRKPEKYLWYRFSEIKLKKKEGIFLFNGYMEVVNEKMLVMEGEMVGEILFNSLDNNFRFLGIEVSTRFRVRF